MDEPKWYDDHDNLWLCASVQREIDDAFDVYYFLEKPWKWTDEWELIEGLEPGLSVQDMAAALAKRAKENK